MFSTNWCSLHSYSGNLTSDAFDYLGDRHFGAADRDYRVFWVGVANLFRDTNSFVAPDVEHLAPELAVSNNGNGIGKKKSDFGKASLHPL